LLTIPDMEEVLDYGRSLGFDLAFKDHVSLAGLPHCFGSHFMDGYIPDFDATSSPVCLITAQ
jgi:Asp-tRNA(Asn)/Glu-tRNA(Gln) amidotransferase A subunit family amidase